MNGSGNFSLAGQWRSMLGILIRPINTCHYANYTHYDATFNKRQLESHAMGRMSFFLK